MLSKQENITMKQKLLKPRFLHKFTASDFKNCSFVSTTKKINKPINDIKSYKVFNFENTVFRSSGPIYFRFEECRFKNCNFAQVELNLDLFSYCHFENCKFPFRLPDQHKVMKRTAKHIIKNKLTIFMKSFHVCDTVHCVAGWAYTIHPSLKKLEDKIGSVTLTYLLFQDYRELIYETDEQKAWTILEKIAKSK